MKANDLAVVTAILAELVDLEALKANIWKGDAVMAITGRDKRFRPVASSKITKDMVAAYVDYRTKELKVALADKGVIYGEIQK